MLSYLNWINEDFTIRIEDRSFEQIKEQLLLFCIDPTSVFKRDTNNLQLYTQIYNTTTLNELTPYLAWIKRGDYVQALTNWFKQLDDKEKKFREDYSVISDTLQKYRKIRSNFRPMPDPETGDLKDYSIYKDILQFKNLDEFYDVMALFEKEQTKAEKLREIKEDVLVVHYTDNLKILVPLTADAAEIYGKGTKWCTTTSKMFIHYGQQGPLFIIIKDNEKYQFHIETKSYMNALDKHIKNYETKFVYELNLIEEWRKNNLKTYYNIIEFSKRDILITKDNYMYAKYLKYNKDILGIDINYLDQNVVNILDALKYDIFIDLEFEDKYSQLHNKRPYHIFYKDKYKEYFKEELKYNPEYMLNIFYKIDGSYKIIDDKFYIQGNLEFSKMYKELPPIVIEEVSGNFTARFNNLISLEYGPKQVNGDYNCSSNKLTSLKGCPEIIGGSFICSYNKLESLKYGPKQVGGDYRCNDNRLDSLEYGPKQVNGNYNCFSNKLTSLKGCAETISGDFNCIYNKLTSLKGCPEIIGGSFYCSNNQLESLEYGPKQVGGNFNCYNNKLKTLKGCTEIISGDFNCSYNQLESLEYGPKQVNGSYNCTNNKIKLERPAKVIITDKFINL